MGYLLAILISAIRFALNSWVMNDNFRLFALAISARIGRTWLNLPFNEGWVSMMVSMDMVI